VIALLDMAPTFQSARWRSVLGFAVNGANADKREPEIRDTL
jgi:hypothetical protein